MTINGLFVGLFWPIKFNMAKNAKSSGRNENLRPLLNSNRGIVTIY